MDYRAMIRQARTALRRRGLDIGRTDPDCPVYGYLELMIFPVLGIDCIIDVGGCRGEFGQHMRDFGYAGRIVSFEPVSGNYEILRARAQADGSWFTHQYALGDRDGEEEMYVTRGPFWNSLLKPSAYGMDQFEADLTVEKRERVQVRRLDSLYEECVRGLNNPRVYLKVDTQGYDRHVLLGAERSLPAIPALQTEVSFKEEYEGMTAAADMISLVEGLGYSLSGIFKVFRDSRLALVEADGVFVRPGAAA